MLEVNSVEAFFNGDIRIPQFDDHVANQARAHQNQLTKPHGSLGRLEEFAIWMAGWQRKINPTMDNTNCLIFAGNHGVATNEVSAYPSNVTAQMVENFKNGGAAINQLCELADIKLSVIPIDLEQPTRDFSREAAMGLEETMAAMQLGFDAVTEDYDLLVLGEMGISNTTAATAIACALFNQPVELWTGIGTGLDTNGLSTKISVIESALKLHGKKFRSTKSILATLGGRELAAIVGSIIAARLLRIPVLLDGFICTSAAATLTIFDKKILDHCLISHLSTEPGHNGVLKFLNKKPILDLNMRLGEGSGAAIASLKIDMQVLFKNRYIIDFVATVMFFTRIPVNWAFFSDEAPNLTRAAWAFPLIGYFIGFCSGIIGDIGLFFGLSTFVSCILAIIFSVMLSGAFHEDGLADMADGFGAGGSPERVNEIMHDSRLGTYGVTALTLGLLIRVGLVVSLVDLGYSFALIMGIGFASGKLAIIITRKFYSPSNFAKTGSIIGFISAKNILLATFIFLVPVVFILSIFSILIGAIFVAIAICLIGFRSNHHLGGITGDVLGAIAFSSELLFLLGILFVFNGVPW